MGKKKAKDGRAGPKADVRPAGSDRLSEETPLVASDDAALEAEFLALLDGIQRHVKDPSQQQDMPPSTSSKPRLADATTDGIFDIFETSEADDKLALPSTTKVFDLALEEHMQQAPCASTDHSCLPTSRTQCGPAPQKHMPHAPCAQTDLDATKQFQDDVHTPAPLTATPRREPWCDIDPADDDLAGLCHGLGHLAVAVDADAVLDDEKVSNGHVNLNSQALPTALDFGTHAHAELPDVFPASDDDELDEDACAGSFSAGDSGAHPQTPRTQCGLLPQEHMQYAPCASMDHSGHTAEPLPLRGTGSPGTSPGGGHRDVDDLLMSQDLRTQCGPMPQGRMQQAPCALSDHSGLHTSRTQFGPMQQEHMQQAPCASPDLGMPSSRTQCGLMPQEHMQQAPCASADHSGMPTSRTQCRPLPQEHMQQPPCASSDHSGMQSSRTQYGPLQQHMQQAPCASTDRTSRTQCGLDLEGLNIFDFDLDAEGSLQPTRTQCSPLPQEHILQAPCAKMGHSGMPSSRTQCGFLPQHMQQAPCAQTDHSGMLTSQTQCEPLPQQFMQQAHQRPPQQTQAGKQRPPQQTQAGCQPRTSTVQPLEDTLAQLLATTCAPSPSLEERYARLEAYAAATRAALAHYKLDGFDGGNVTVSDSTTASGQLAFGPSAAQLASERPPRGKGLGKQGKGRRCKGSNGKRSSVTDASP